MYQILQRVKTGWTFTRGLYVVMGAIIVIQATMAGQWVGMFLGIYFLSMGVFAFGCAGGNCAVPPVKNNAAPNTVDVTYEEIK